MTYFTHCCQRGIGPLRAVLLRVVRFAASPIRVGRGSCTGVARCHLAPYLITMTNTYCSLDDGDQDKAQLAELLKALNAWPSALRRDDSSLWILRGRPGCYISTWGDGTTWQLVVTPDEMIRKRVEFSPEELARRQQQGRRLGGREVHENQASSAKGSD